MKVLRTSVVIHSTDHQSALRRYEKLFAAHFTNEFHIPRRDLVVTVFPGFSILSGSAEALASLRDLRATIFVDSLKELEEQLVETGLMTEGTLGSKGSILVRDPDGNLIEFVEDLVH